MSRTQMRLFLVSGIKDDKVISRYVLAKDIEIAKDKLKELDSSIMDITAEAFEDLRSKVIYE